jgi:hypothetical protein
MEYERTWQPCNYFYNLEQQRERGWTIGDAGKKVIMKTDIILIFISNMLYKSVITGTVACEL